MLDAVGRARPAVRDDLREVQDHVDRVARRHESADRVGLVEADGDRLLALRDGAATRASPAATGHELVATRPGCRRRCRWPRPCPCRGRAAPRRWPAGSGPGGSASRGISFSRRACRPGPASNDGARGRSSASRPAPDQALVLLGARVGVGNVLPHQNSGDRREDHGRDRGDDSPVAHALPLVAPRRPPGALRLARREAEFVSGRCKV